MRGLLSILLLLLLPALASGVAPEDFAITHNARDASGRLVVQFPAEEGFYYTLLRGPVPQTITFPAAMSTGEWLRDNVDLRQRAFYKVQRTPWTTPTDTDGDGINDWTEVQNKRHNPLNPALLVAAADGAIILPSRALFDSVSHRDNFPGAPDVREVKFLIMGADTAKPALYFLNANKHVYHYYFARDVLAYPRSLSAFNTETYFSNTARKQMAGSLVVHESWQPPGGGPSGVVTMEFWPSDPVSYPFVQKAYDLVSRSMTWLDKRFAYHAASETQRTIYRTERTQYEAALRDKLDVITTEQLFGQTSYTMLNPGVGFGRLIVYDSSTPLSARDVVIFRTLPNEITRTAGIITEVPQTPLSHINLKAKQNNTPNAYIKAAGTDPRLSPFLGMNVRYETLADGFTVRAATQEEVDTHLEALRPVNPQTPVRDLTKRTILPLASLGFASAAGYGAKTANVAELRKFLPATMVPDGHGIPFYYYDEYMKYNGFYAWATAMMAEARFHTDAEYRRLSLTGLRAAIEHGTLPAWMVTDLTTLQNRFAAGVPIRCRSSTNNEDLTGFSGAGLYDSYTHRPDEGHLGETVTKVWASMWNERAWDEREFYRVDHLIAAMGVLCHPNQDDERANGVAVSKNIIDPNWTGYYVNAQLGESLVTNPDPNAIPEEFLIAQLLGSTRYTIQHVTYSNLVPEGQTVITTAQAEQLADRLASIHNRFLPLYGGISGEFAMEIEWKITSTGALQIKQARPWVE